jgi:hypothetical protein
MYNCTNGALLRCARSKGDKMQIAVVVERVKGNGYRARGAEPFALTGKGATREEAMRKLRDKIQARLKSGAEVVALEISSGANPWVEFAGMFKDDPLMAEWKKAMADYRKRVDEDPEYL